MTLKTTAALLTKPGFIDLEEVEFDLPGSGQIVVRMAAAGVCHTDLHIKQSPDGWGRQFPLLLGHEGSGVVEEVGPAVTDILVGDHVAIACRVPCGECTLCRRGDTRRCSNSSPVPARVQISQSKTKVTPALGIGLFAESVVVDANAAVVMPTDFDLHQAAIMGCALMTGIGAVTNTAQVFPGSDVAVIGCGGIGLSAVQGARLAGAGRIIAIDISAAKLDSARKLGATDVVDSSTNDAVEAALDLTDGKGVDFAFEAVGLPECVDQCLGMLAVGGVVTVIGVPQPESKLELQLGGDQGLFSKTATIVVSHGGDSLPKHDLRAMYLLAQQGLLDIGAMVTHRVALAELNEGFELMKSGQAIRAVVDFDGFAGE